MSTGAYTYTPNTGAMGGDTFVFSVANAANPTLSTTATMTVTVVGIILTATSPSPQLTETPITLTASAGRDGHDAVSLPHRVPQLEWQMGATNSYRHAAIKPAQPSSGRRQSRANYTLVAYAKDRPGNNPMTYISYIVAAGEPDRRDPDGQSVSAAGCPGRPSP